MLSWPRAFNMILAGTVVVLAIGCASSKSKPKKESQRTATLSFYLEVNQDSLGKSSPVPVFRAQPVQFNFEKSPFMDERVLDKAEVIDVMGTPALRVECNRLGRRILENITGVNRGRHIGIYSEFDTPLARTNRWLAAPLIGRLVTNGVLSFTVDANEEEIYLIANGLSNVIDKRKKQNQLPDIQ